MNSTIKLKIVNSLEKCFLDDNIDSFIAIDNLSFLKGEKLCFQLVYTDTNANAVPQRLRLMMDGEISKFATVRQVINVPSVMPVSTDGGYDENYLRTKPGLFPELLLPLHYNNNICTNPGNLLSAWIEIDVDNDFKCGDYRINFSVLKEWENECLAEAFIDISYIDYDIGKSELPHAEWMYCDCLAEYYGVEVFSERHWQIIESYIKTAVKNEINTILTPVFTPALDTYMNGERLTTQLVDISLNNGLYSFNFDKFDRFVDICKRQGVVFYEIPPFFTQWGAKAAPKFMGCVNGEYKKLFGWETDAASDEYQNFLKQFVTALLERLRQLGIDKNTFFQISDEPTPENYNRYREISKNVKEILSGYKFLDTIQHIEAIKEGIVSTPVVSVRIVEDFINQGIDNTWCYYCCGPTKETTNRFLSMPLSRLRILGVQMYKYDVKGFLHWGYNYYHNRLSYNTLNPYMDTCGEYFAPSGDAFIVYPADDGTAYETIRLVAIRDAFQDYKALKACEKRYGREYVINQIQCDLDYELSFKKYPMDSQYLIKLRNRINKSLEE
jgi:hypothetical protein